MLRLPIFEVGSKIIAKTHIAPLPGKTVFPGMAGEILECNEITRQHKVRFENGRELWATSDQVKLDPARAPKEASPAAAE